MVMLILLANHNICSTPVIVQQGRSVNIIITSRQRHRFRISHVKQLGNKVWCLTRERRKASPGAASDQLFWAPTSSIPCPSGRRLLQQIRRRLP